MDFLALAIKKLQVEPAQVSSYRIDDENQSIVLVVDYGIAGAKKFTFLAADLAEPEPVDVAEIEAVKVDELKERLLPKRERKRG
jgi:hypothetical protein